MLEHPFFLVYIEFDNYRIVGGHPTIYEVEFSDFAIGAFSLEVMGQELSW